MQMWDDLLCVSSLLPLIIGRLHHLCSLPALGRLLEAMLVPFAQADVLVRGGKLLCS